VGWVRSRSPRTSRSAGAPGGATTSQSPMCEQGPLWHPRDSALHPPAAQRAETRPQVRHVGSLEGRDAGFDGGMREPGKAGGGGGGTLASRHGMRKPQRGRTMTASVAVRERGGDGEEGAVVWVVRNKSAILSWWTRLYQCLCRKRNRRCPSYGALRIPIGCY